MHVIECPRNSSTACVSQELVGTNDIYVFTGTGIHWKKNIENGNGMKTQARQPLEIWDLSTCTLGFIVKI